MSIERELGQITEAVSSLKKEQGEFREDLKESVRTLVVSVASVNTKLDAHLTNYANFNFKVGKIAGTVALCVTLILAFAKEAVAALFSNR